MAINNSQRAVFAPELRATMTGTPVLIGTLDFNPVIIIFDNQGDVDVEIIVNDETWHSFPGGEALVLDLRAAHGLAANFTIDKGTSFYGDGASGDFSISYLYAREN